MVAILLAAARVSADGLQMAVGTGTDPYVAPCRRNDDRTDARDLVRITQALSIGIEIDESAPRSPAANPRQRVADVAQPGAPSRLDRGFAHSARSKRRVSERLRGRRNRPARLCFKS